MCNNPNYRLDIKAAPVQAALSHWKIKLCRNGFIPDLYTLKWAYEHGLGEYIQELPCGQCMDCLNNWTSQWTARCMLEARQYDSNLFVTLTYDEDSVPREPFINPVTGEVTEIMTLARFAVQKFMKRLRRWCEINGLPSPRVFYCGEYGDETKRPHYHLTLFNCRFDDALYKFTKKGIRYYSSKILSKLWKFGSAFFSDVSPASMRYVASYTCKNRRPRRDPTLTDEEQAKFFRCNMTQMEIIPLGLDTDLVPKQFVGASRRPALGRKAFDECYETLVRFDQIPAGWCKVRHLRYFDRLMHDYHPIAFEVMKSKRVKRPPVEPPDGITIEEYRRRREEMLRERAMRKVREI